jgi:rhodanese-related sulfurtransferase
MRNAVIATLMVVIFFSIMASVIGQDSKGYERISVEMLMEDIESSEDLILLDVRTANEYEAGHISGAINIDFFLFDFPERAKTYLTNKPVYVYCRSGKRSRKASVIMQQLGFSDIKDIEGGIKAYQKLISE